MTEPALGPRFAVEVSTQKTSVIDKAGNPNVLGAWYSIQTPTPTYYQEYIIDKSMQHVYFPCITSFCENDVVKRHTSAW